MSSFPFWSRIRIPVTRSRPRRRLMASMMPSLQDASDVPSQPVSEPQDNDANDSIPLQADRNASKIMTLPTELLMYIMGYLAFGNVQYLNRASFYTYKKTHKDLRSVCLVSKQMDAVARQYLYRAIMVNNADVLVYLVRSLDENRALGPHIKRLVLDVPFTLEGGHYRKPNVAVLRSRRNFSDICQMAADASDFAKYQLSSLQAQQFSESRGWKMKDLTFRKWAWQKESNILGRLYFDVLLRSTNLQSLCFGAICSATPNDVFPYISLFSRLESAVQFGFENVPGFLSKLQHLQLLGDNREREGPFSMSFLTSLLEISSLQTLDCFHDNGAWFRLDPRRAFRIHMPQPSSWQCKNITCIDLQRSHCTPRAIFQICATFPSLECLRVTLEHGTAAKSYHDSIIDGFGTRNFLSTALSKLEHLQELVLNLHYQHDVKSTLGEHGVLNLGGLNKLTKIRLPLHFLVEAQAGNRPFVTNLEQVLPPSVKHLTVWASRYSVRSWGKALTLFSVGPTLMTVPPYHPRQSALDFMGLVSGLLTTHLKHLEEVTYCYGDQDLDSACHCGRDMLCSHCKASQLLDVFYQTDDSPDRMQILSSIFEARGVCLRTSQEQFEDWTSCER